jgi:hypothetical protein
MLAFSAFIGCDTNAPTQPITGTVPHHHSEDISLPTMIGESKTESPQRIFSVAQAAAKENDIPGILECHSRETQDEFATQVVFAAAMMRFVANKYAERGDNRYAVSKGKVDAVLDKYGVDLSNISEDDLRANDVDLEPFRQLGASIDNRPAFVAELLTELEAAKGTESTGFQDELFGELVSVSVRGTIAEGELVQSKNGREVRKPIYFKKTKDGWRIHMPAK